MPTVRNGGAHAFMQNGGSMRKWRSSHQIAHDRLSAATTANGGYRSTANQHTNDDVGFLPQQQQQPGSYGAAFYGTLPRDLAAREREAFVGQYGDKAIFTNNHNDEKAVQSSSEHQRMSNANSRRGDAAQQNGAKAGSSDTKVTWGFAGRLRSAISEMSLRQPKCCTTMLTDQDVIQVEMMYKSRRTQVVACSCLANLYFSTCSSNVVSSQKDWELSFTGVPIIVLDKGDIWVRTPERTLSIILAEKGTGFTLWRDHIDFQSKYTEVERTFHTFVATESHRRIAGLSFDNGYAASLFYQKLKELASDPQNVAVRRASEKGEKKSHSKERRNSMSATNKKMTSWLKKAQISTPCCFQHITSIRPSDVMMLSSDGSDVSRLSPDDRNSHRTQSCVQISPNVA